MEYVIGPVLALLVSMKFTAYKAKKTEEAIETANKELIVLTNRMDAHDTEMPKRTAALLVPVAKAIKALNEQVGIQ